MNPIGFDSFNKDIKDRKILIIQNRNVGYTYKQNDPDNDLLSLEGFRRFVQETTERAKETGETDI